MAMFDTLAEMRMREWFRRPAAERAQTPAPPPEESSFEGHLLNEIKTLIETAATQQGAARAETLKKAGGLEIQLLVSLENGGYRLLARDTQKAILRHRMRCLDADA